MRGLISHPDYEIEYFVYGNGENLLFAFHGFNNHAEDFSPLGNIPGFDYRIISLNIFFHGDSQAYKHLVKKGFSKEDLKELFDDLANRFPAKKYTLMGYSLGGRIVLKLLEIYPEKIDRIILLAPDGIRISLFYRFLTQTLTGQKLMERVIENPTVFLTLAGFLRKTGMVSEKRFQFAMGNFDTEKKRKKVFQVWMTLRKIVSDKNAVKDLIRKYHIPVHLFFGKYDNIIPPAIGKKFQMGMDKNVTLNVLESGHRLLKDQTLREIAQKLLEIKNDSGKF